MSMDAGPVVAKFANGFMAPVLQQFDWLYYSDHFVIFKIEEPLQK